MKRWMVVALVMLFVLPVGVFAQVPQEGEENPMPMMRSGPGLGCHGQGVEHLMMLGLTDDQITQVMNARHETQMSLLKVHRELFTLREEQKTLMENPIENEKKLKKNAAREAEFRTEIMVAQKKSHDAFLSILTDEQKTKLEEMPMGPPMGSGHGQHKRPIKPGDRKPRMGP